MDGLSAQVTAGFPALSTLPPVPVLPALQEVIPGGGLRPGSVTGVEDSITLALALAAGIGDEWAAIVGLPEVNIDALTAMRHRPDRTSSDRADPPRLLLVDDPGPRWADAVAALTEACALVLTRSPERPSPHATRRLIALARRNGCALVVAGRWQGADLRLHVEHGQWTGLGAGHGHLRGRRALVTASGRGAAGAGARVWLWLPGPDGSVTVAEEATTTSHLPLTATG